MNYVISFFRFLFDCVVKALQFLWSAPGLLFASVTTLITSISSVFVSLSNGNNAINSFLDSTSTDFMDGITSTLTNMPSIMQWLAYMLSLDILFDGLIAIFGIVFPVVLVIVTFFVITVPYFLISYYMIKFVLWLSTSVLPEYLVPPSLQIVATEDRLMRNEKFAIDNGIYGQL